MLVLFGAFAFVERELGFSAVTFTFLAAGELFAEVAVFFTLSLVGLTLLEAVSFGAAAFEAMIFRPLTFLPVVALGEFLVAVTEPFAVLAFLAEALAVVLVDFVVFGDFVLATDNLV